MFPAAVQPNLDRPLGDVESAGNLSLRQVRKISQNQGLFFGKSQFVEGLLAGDLVDQRRDPVLGDRRHGADALVLGVPPAPVDEPIGLVARDRGQPGIGPVDGRACVGGTSSTQQCLLRGLLGVLAVMEHAAGLTDAAPACGMPILGASLHYSKSGV